MAVTNRESTEKRQESNLLHDFYGDLLTPKQSACYVMYYMEDYSLSEIGGIYQITPQAVADLLKRTNAILQRYEAKLGLLCSYQAQQTLRVQINVILDELSRNCADGAGSAGENPALAGQLAKLRVLINEL